MSHFTVLVTGDTEEDMEHMLAPFQENNMGDCPEEYMVFQDESEEVRKEYVEGVVDRIKGPNGFIYRRDDDLFKQPKEDSSLKSWQYIYPSGYEEIEVPWREVYDTEKEFAKEVYGMPYNEEHDGYGYMSNPNCRWDWYQVGGRWTGALRLKEVAIALRMYNDTAESETIFDGSPGIMTSPNKEIEFCDSCLIKQLDVEWHRVEARRRAGAMWDAWHNPDRPERPASRDDWGLLSNEEREAVMEYERENGILFIDTDEVDRLISNNREPYLEMFGAPKAITYGFVSEDGEWNERAHMGWFGTHWDDNADYDVEFWRWIESLNGSTRIWVVDCHI